MQEFRVPRSGELDLVFVGDLLADESTREGDEQERWTEVRIYRTDAGQYVTEVIGRSVRRGEHDKISTSVHESPASVPSGLRRRGRSGATGEQTWFIPNVCLDALAEAQERDPALAAAAAERI